MSVKFDIYFSGVVLTGSDPVLVRQKVGQMCKANDALLDKLFSGKAVRLKSGVDQETAIKYRLSFRKMGASIDIKAVDQPSSVPKKIREPLVKSVFNAPDDEPVKKSTFVEKKVLANNVVGKSVFSAGSDTLSNKANFDSSSPSTVDASKSLKPGEKNLEYEQGFLTMEVPDVNFDLSPPGVTIDQAIEADASPIEIITPLELNPANSGSLKDCVQEESVQALPDIDHLELV